MDLKQKIIAKKENNSLRDLKVRLAGAYSSSKNVFFFENTDDIETYKIWLGKIRPNLMYHPYPLKGKDKCLEAYEYFKNQEGYEKSYFFVDHDFNGSKGYEVRNNLFITDRYAIENYLFDPEIIISYLQAEFKCYEPNNIDNLNRLKDIYTENLNKFLEILKSINFQIFLSSLLSIDVKISDNKKIKDIIVIELDRCFLKENANISIMLDEDVYYHAAQKVDLVKLDEYWEIFCSLKPIESYRGKFIHFFFKEWLSKLKEIHNSNSSDVKYFNSKNAKFDPNIIDLYKYANYSSIPIGLDKFIEEVA